MGRSKSSHQWMQRHVNDEYVKRSQVDGYRSRASYKLLEIQERDSIIAEVEIALDVHELIKLNISVGDRDARDEIIHKIIDQAGAELVQRIGNTAVLFRRNPKAPKVALPSK